MNDIEICPICRKPYSERNPKVQYHTQYKPIPEFINACKSCNYAEYLSRHWLRYLTTWQWRKIKLVREYKKQKGI
ncbi:MAG: hypothetical protein WAX85_02090 [Minisyncoccia bacterium]